MSRHRSDESGDDYSRKPKKKKKKRALSRIRSSSGSDSSRVSRPKKSKKKHRKSRSRSRSVDKRRPEGRSRRSRSRSTEKYASTRTRSHSKSPGHRSRRRSRSRSRSPSDRRQHSPSYSRSKRRSRSYSRDRRSRSRSTGKSSSKRSSPDRRRETSHSRGSPANVALKGLSLLEQDVMESLTPAEQAEHRMRLALKAAALADEQLRLRNIMDDSLSHSNPSLSVLDRQDFASSVAQIESDGFVTSSFSWSRSNAKVKDEPTEHRLNHDDAIFGSLSVTGFTIKPDLDTRPINTDADSIMHPSLYCDPDEKMDRWIQKVRQMRRKLEGEAM